MTHSVNEVETLLAKAARGAGAPPAQAMAFGRAATHHLAQHRDEADLIAALHALPEGPILSLALCAGSDSALAASYRNAAARAVLPPRLTPSKALLDTAGLLAHQTYVPASDASRTAGAGAGLTDND